jgi:hypothetical protein
MPVPIRPPINTPAPAVSPGTPAPTPGPVVAPAPVRPTTITPTPVRPPVVSPVQIPRSGQRQSAPPQSEPARPANAARAEPAPFDADLDSILYASDRRLALVDGRIVEAGDVVRGATVVEITTTAVMLRDDRGQLRRLTANGRGR